MEFLTEVGKQVPSLAVLVFVVIAFLRHSRAFADTMERISRDNINAMRQISDETNMTIRENTRILGATNSLLSRASGEKNARCPGE